MNTPSSKLKPSVVFLLLALLLGGFVRLWPVLNAAFPINDGGLFYMMTRDLMANGYRLPLTVSYNGLDLPFAYPPLPFYLAAALADLAGWDLLDLFRLLPALFSLLAVPAFYLLARDLLEDDDQVSLAVLAFALVPPSFDWLIMGGGLTRAPAFLFSLLTLHCAYWLYADKRQWNILWTAVFAALTILCHPEAGLHAAAGALALFLFFGRNRAGLGKSLAVAGLVLALTAPWWGAVLVRHGATPFLAAARTSGHGLDSVFLLFKFDLTGEHGLQTIGALALIGLFWQLARRQAFLPAWVLLTFFVEPRSAPLSLAPCMALLAALALGRIFQAFPGKQGAGQAPGELFHRRGVKPALGVLLAQWLFSAMALVLLEGGLTVSAADRQAFDWIRANTPAESRFLVLTGNEPMTDPVSEWFPALAERRSLATVQGYEWIAATDFGDVMQKAQEAQGCFFRGPACVDAWPDDNRVRPDYLYLGRQPAPSSGEAGAFEQPLENLLLATGEYALVYQAPGIAILRSK